MKYRTYWQRFCASFIDGLVLMPVSWLHPPLFNSQSNLIVLIVWTTIYYSIFWLYSVLLHAHYGQTLGKMVTRIRVLDLTEERNPNLKQAFVRDIGPVIFNTLYLLWFIYFIATQQHTNYSQTNNDIEKLIGYASIGWLVLEIVTMGSNSKRRAFHDYIAGTVVVRC